MYEEEAEVPMTPFQDPDVQAVFDRCAPAVRARLLALREAVFEEADALDCGPLEEALRWGEPAYLTSTSKTGTTIRLDARGDAACALYVHCRTTLVAEARARHGDVLRTEGNRAILVDVAKPPPEEALRDVIRRALTYKVRKRAR